MNLKSRPGFITCDRTKSRLPSIPSATQCLLRDVKCLTYKGQSNTGQSSSTTLRCLLGLDHSAGSIKDLARRGGCPYENASREQTGATRGARHHHLQPSWSGGAAQGLQSSLQQGANSACSRAPHPSWLCAGACPRFESPDPAALPQTLQVVAAAKEVSHPDNQSAFTPVGIG